jgi:hypothetical protein
MQVVAEVSVEELLVLAVAVLELPLAQEVAERQTLVAVQVEEVVLTRLLVVQVL